MVRHEGGRWDVGVDGDAVYVERISEGDESLFEDSLTPEEARQLAGLLRKYADKADEAEDSDESDDSDKSEDSDKSDDKSDDSDKSDKSDKPDDKSDDSDRSEG